MLGSLSIEQIDALLKNETVGRIGFIAGAKVSVVPIAYAYQDGYIYGRSHEGQKITAMRKDPNVCFEVDTMTTLTNWKSVILWGTFEEMKTPEETTHVMKVLADRITPLLQSETMRPAQRLPEPHPHNAGVKAIAFRIKVQEKSGKYESSFW